MTFLAWLYGYVGEPAEEWWQVPVSPSQQLHAGGDQYTADQSCIKEHGHGQPKPRLLIDHHVSRGEPTEHGDHD